MVGKELVGWLRVGWLVSEELVGWNRVGRSSVVGRMIAMDLVVCEQSARTFICSWTCAFQHRTSEYTLRMFGSFFYSIKIIIIILLIIMKTIIIMTGL